MDPDPAIAHYPGHAAADAAASYWPRTTRAAR